MTELKTKYSSLVSSALAKDRFWLSNELEKISKFAVDGKPYDRLLTKFEERLSASLDTVTRRSALVPKLNYPEALPVAEKRADIVKAIQENQVVVVAGETGSGKTTQLPKMCLEAGRGIFGRIGHTQPRRLAARSVADRIAEELNCEIGKEVGYQVRFNDQSSQDSLIKVMTDGILLSEIQHDRYLNQYDTIIIDEAHERSLNIDFILGVLKQLLPKRPDLKLIITSATIDVDRFSKHFNDAPVFEVSGRTYPVEVRYRPLLNEDAEEEDLDIYQGIVEAVRELEDVDRNRGQRGDVLIFLSGEREIREAAETLRKAQLKATEILPLYARLSAAEQQKIFHPHGGKRIVLSTNVAETSLTVPGIKYVIDTGLARISRYSYKSKVQRLPIEKISQASANQRKGRCGRVSEGICIRLYDENDFLSRPEFTDPEIRRTNLASVILQMNHMKFGAVERFPFIDAPDNRFIKDGVNLLKELGALSQKGHLTDTGKQLARLPLDPRIAKMLIEANKQGSLKEVMIIASALSVQDPKERPQDKQAQADQKHAQYKDQDSDFLTYLNLWNDYEEQRQELSQNQLRKHCKKEFLSFMRMREWRDVHRQLKLVVKELGLDENKEDASYEAIHKALLSGLLSQLGFKTDEGDYLGARNKRFHIFPGSSLSKARPKWIMVAEQVETSRLFGRTAAKVAPEWVEPLAKNLVKKSYQEPHWVKKRGQVVAFEQVTLYGLIIVPKRKVSYDNIDPKVAHEIFIQSALVENQLITKGKFLQKNAEVIKEVEALESKARKRDILVDDHVIYQFYEERVPKEVSDQRSFEKWRKEAEKDKSDVLVLTKEYLMRQDADHVTEELYPDSFGYKGYQFPLTYRFEPNHPLDGVTISIPAALVSQLNEAPFEWLVAGLLRDKCVALIKSLPKAIRKQLVPVPDFVTGFLSSGSDRSLGLAQAIEQYVYKVKRIKIDSDDWNMSQVEPHLLMNFNVLDEDGESIANNRSLSSLKNQFKDYKAKGDPIGDENDFDKADIDTWDFGHLPESWEVESAGMSVNLFPAVVENGHTVDLKLLDHPKLAEYESKRGIVLLAKRKLVEQVKYLDQKVPFWLGKQSIVFSSVGTKKDLVDSIIEQGLLHYLCEPSIPRDQGMFEERVSLAKAELVEYCEDLTDYLKKLFTQLNDINQTLKKKMSLPNALAFTDIKNQLSNLFYKTFITDVKYDQLRQYDRYMLAIATRIDRLQGNQQKDKLAMNSVTDFEHKLAEYSEQLGMPLACFPNLEAFRWSLEEYRISLFAQPQKTIEPVSEKRLKKRWEELMEEMRHVA